MSNIFTDIVTIPANDQRELPHSGDFFEVITSDDAFTLVLDTGSRFESEAKIGFKEISYEALTFINETASPIDVKFYYGDGGEITIKDFAISGTVQTNDAATQALLTTMDAVLDNIKTNTDNLSAMATSLTSILSMMQNDEDQRAGLTTLEGASFIEVDNATTTIVTAGANTNGIIVRHAYALDGGTGYSYLLADGKILVGSDTSGTLAGWPMNDIQNFFIPAGVSLSASSTNAGNSVFVWYEVL